MSSEEVPDGVRDDDSVTFRFQRYGDGTSVMVGATEGSVLNDIKFDGVYVSSVGAELDGVIDGAEGITANVGGVDILLGIALHNAIGSNVLDCVVGASLNGTALINSFEGASVGDIVSLKVLDGILRSKVGFCVSADDGNIEGSFKRGW